ncbi:MAG: hypothetical protein WBO10_04380 [Pyrinomonadaceae bacterium]
MYERCNDISNEQQFRFGLEQIQLNERLAFVDSVCAVLIESRYGHGRSEGMVRNSVWKFETERVDRFDLGCEIFSADVIRRHYYQRECALASVGSTIGRRRAISYGLGTDLANLFKTTVSEPNADATTISINPTFLCDNHSRPPP